MAASRASSFMSFGMGFLVRRAPDGSLGIPSGSVQVVGDCRSKELGSRPRSLIRSRRDGERKRSGVMTATKPAHLERDDGVPNRQPFGRQDAGYCPEEPFVSGDQDTASGIVEQYGGKDLFTGIDILDIGQPPESFRCVNTVQQFVADDRDGRDGVGEMRQNWREVEARQHSFKDAVV
jgi:hypothetical protein